ncbi:hypothetical protein DIE19_28685 [Burkholderia sp. Bp9126]|nr:hypothetical protein DIE19_28685 [Burkholderia sp. Bp9126]
MSILGKGLSKLTIESFTTRELSGWPNKTLTVMYNPASISLQHGVEYSQVDNVNFDTTYTAVRVQPGELELELLFDATLPGNTKPIDAQIAELQATCFWLCTETRAPSFLRLSWGHLKWSGMGAFSGVATKMSTRYTLFDRDGTPLRASVNLTLFADPDSEIQEAVQGTAIPTAVMLPVPDLATLPMLAAAAAAAAAATATVAGALDYLTLAIENDLDSLSDLAAGGELLLNTSEHKPQAAAGGSPE